MKTTFLTILTTVSLAAGSLSFAQAGEEFELGKTKDLKIIAGSGMCAKCELGKADSCQNAVQVEKEGKKITYLMAKNDVAKDFHGKICQSTKKVAAVGKVEEKDGSHVIHPIHVAELKEKSFTGTGLCAKCELGKTDKCQSMVKAKEDGKEVLYFIADNQTAKDFHGKICQSTAKVAVKGHVGKLGKNTYVLLADKLEAQ